MAFDWLSGIGAGLGALDSIFDFSGSGAEAKRQAAYARQMGQKSGTFYDQLAQGGAYDRNLYEQNFKPNVDRYQQNLANNPANTLYTQGTVNSPLLQAFLNAGGVKTKGGTNNPADASNQYRQNVLARRNPNASGNAPGSAANTLNTDRAGTPGSNGWLNSSGVAQNPQAQLDTSGDPYALAPAQAAQLNQQVDQINSAMTNAIAEYRARAAQQGIAASPAGEQQIREHFAGLAEQSKASFTEQSRKSQQDMLQTLINQGQQAYGDQTQGFLNVANQYQQAGQSGQQAIQNAASGYGNLAGQQNQMAQYAQQQDNQNQGQTAQSLAYLISSLLQNGNRTTQTKKTTSGVDLASILAGLPGMGQTP